MGVRLPTCTCHWTRAVVFVWCCFASPLMPHRSLSTGLLVAEGVSSNSTALPPPPQPTSNLRCFSFNFLSVTCEWTRGGDINSTDALYYRKFPSGMEWNPCNYVSSDVCSSTHCQWVCSSCTRCDYMVRTSNTLGATADSDSVCFNVYTDSKLKPPSDVRVTNESVVALRITWKQPYPKPSGTEYLLEYKWEGSDSWRQKEKIEKEMKVLIDLEHPYGLYYVRVKALKKTYPIESNFTDIAQGRTTEQAPVDIPTKFVCEDAPNKNNKTRHVHLSWEPLQNKFKLNGEILGYVIKYTRSEADTPISLNVGANDTSYTVYDLRKDRSYVFSIWARNSMGTSSRKATCSKIIPIPVTSSVGIVVGVCIFVVAFVIILIVIWCYIKKSLRKFPAIKLPSQLQADNEYLSEHKHPAVVREMEVFDDLKPCQLFVDLGPKQTDIIDFFGDMPIITNGFDIGNKPRGAVGFPNDIIDLDSLPLLGLKGELTLDDSGSATAPLLPGPRREEDPSSGEEYGGGALPSSPVSVGSGGSYLGIRDDDDMVYSCMTKDGLSPVERENPEGQRALGERPQDPAPSAQVDGLPLLHWRRESADSEDNNLQDGDAIDSYTKMSASPSRRENAPAAARPARKDPQDERPPNHGTKHPKGTKLPKPSVSAKSKGGGAPAGATCAGDGSISDYVQQGFVPGAAADGDEDYDPGNPADSYSRLGLLEDPRAAASPHAVSLEGGNQDAATAFENWGGDDEDLSILLPEQATSAATGGVPHSQPDAEPRPSNLPSGTPNIAKAQSLDSLSDDEDGVLNYVTVALDSDAESMNGAEPVCLNGYVTQAMIPNQAAPPAGPLPSARVNTAAPSGYVDQAQLSNFSPPPFPRSPAPSPARSPAPPRAHNNPGQMNGAMASGGGYITAAEACDIMSPGPDAGPTHENSTNNNNSNPRARSIEGLASDQPADPNYVTSDRLACLPVTSPPPNEHVNGHPGEPSNSSYVTHNEMLHMAEASSTPSNKTGNGHIGKESVEQMD